MKSGRQLRQVLIRSTGIFLCDIAAVLLLIFCFFLFCFFQATVGKQQRTRTPRRPALCKETAPSRAAHVIICFLNRLNSLFFLPHLCVFCVWYKVAQKEYKEQQFRDLVLFYCVFSSVGVSLFTVSVPSVCCQPVTAQTRPLPSSKIIAPIQVKGEPFFKERHRINVRNQTFFVKRLNQVLRRDKETRTLTHKSIESQLTSAHS